MGKMKIGSNTRSTQVKRKLGDMPNVTSQAQFDEVMVAVEKVMETHKDAFKKLAEYERMPVADPVTLMSGCSDTIHEETRSLKVLGIKKKRDSRARKHSIAVKKEMRHADFMLHKRMDMQAQTARNLCENVAKLEASATLIESLENKISCLEMLKPQEKHILTKETIVRKETPKIVYIGLGIGLVLNILVLILK